MLKYSWLKTDEVLASAEAGVAGGARRVCLVASGRGPTDKDIDRVASTISAFKSRNPEVEVCACLGLLSDGQATRLADAGTTAYNHNLNTSGGHYADICTTHEYADRVSTVESAKSAGLSPCSGLIAGMGETDEDLVDVAFALRALSPDSVPVNFLIPFDGTPLAGEWTLTPQRCLRILAMVRFVCPSAEVRLAGGREIHLRTLQPLALHMVNSIFLGDYLTSEGQPGAADLAMIADAGFTVEGADTDALLAAAGLGAGAAGAAAGDAAGGPSADDTVGSAVGDTVSSAVGDAAGPAAGARPDLVHVRRRGAGTALPGQHLTAGWDRRWRAMLELERMAAAHWRGTRGRVAGGVAAARGRRLHRPCQLGPAAGRPGAAA